MIPRTAAIVPLVPWLLVVACDSAPREAAADAGADTFAPQDAPYETDAFDSADAAACGIEDPETSPYVCVGSLRYHRSRAWSADGRFEAGNVQFLSDLDGDGYAEIVFGDQGFRIPGTTDPWQGAIIVIGAEEFENADVQLDGHPVLAGPYPGAAFGETLVPLGDLDGDGLQDLAVGTSGVHRHNTQSPGEQRIESCVTYPEECGVVWLVGGAELAAGGPLRWTRVESDATVVIGPFVAAVSDPAFDSDALALGVLQRLSSASDGILAYVFRRLKLDGRRYSLADATHVVRTDVPTPGSSRVMPVRESDGPGSRQLLIETGLGGPPGSRLFLQRLDATEELAPPHVLGSLAPEQFVGWTGWHSDVDPTTTLTGAPPVTITPIEDGPGAWLDPLEGILVDAGLPAGWTLRAPPTPEWWPLTVMGLRTILPYRVDDAIRVVGVFSVMRTNLGAGLAYRAALPRDCQPAEDGRCAATEVEWICPNGWIDGTCDLVRGVNAGFLNRDACVDYIIWPTHELVDHDVIVLLSECG